MFAKGILPVVKPSFSVIFLRAVLLVIVRYRLSPLNSIEPATVEESKEPETNLNGATVVEFVARIKVPVIVSPDFETFVARSAVNEEAVILVNNAVEPVTIEPDIVVN